MTAEIGVTAAQHDTSSLAEYQTGKPATAINRDNIPRIAGRDIGLRRSDLVGVETALHSIPPSETTSCTNGMTWHVDQNVSAQVDLSSHSGNAQRNLPAVCIDPPNRPQVLARVAKIISHKVPKSAMRFDFSVLLLGESEERIVLASVSWPIFIGQAG